MFTHTTRWAFAALLASFVLGCASRTGDVSDPEGEESSVVGVTDFSAVESELELQKDSKDAQGKWRRDDASLKNGPCYTKFITNGEGKYELRRYTKGAAFFKKAGIGGASG